MITYIGNLPKINISLRRAHVIHNFSTNMKHPLCKHLKAYFLILPMFYLLNTRYCVSDTTEKMLSTYAFLVSTY